MTAPAARRPFPVPVVAELIGPGSQPEDETLDYITMPQGMQTYRPPALPEPEALQAHVGARRVLEAVLASLEAACRGEAPTPVPLAGLSAADLALVNQVLGEGEVSAQVLADASGPHAVGDTARVRVQESVFAGVWRVLRPTDDGALHDHVEVGAIPAALREAALADARCTPPADTPLPPHCVNLPPLLTELADRRQQWQPGDLPHVVNLTLLPLTAEDIAHLDHRLGTGRVLILSRGYGNCRITSTLQANTWRVVYYNSQDAVILNSVEVCGLPEVACAAPEDLADSRERFAEVLQWVAQP